MLLLNTPIAIPAMISVESERLGSPTVRIVCSFSLIYIEPVYKLGITVAN